jgi:hypothetical protein
MAIALKIICDTYLKMRPVSEMEISEQEKRLVKVDSVLEVIFYIEEKDHYKVILKVPVLGFDTWFVLKDHVKIIYTNNLPKQEETIYQEYSYSPPPPSAQAPTSIKVPTSVPIHSSAQAPTSVPEPTGSPAIFSPSQSSGTIDVELEKLTFGKVLFDAPHHMKVGISERVSVRIAKTITQDFLEKLVHCQEAEIENIRISRYMTVILRGDDFKVEALGNEEQIIEDNDFTQWDWKVMPLKSGNRKLWVIITIQVEIDNEQARKTLPILEKEIPVKINPIYASSTFFSQYWQWLIASAIIPVVGLLLKK